MYRRIRIQVVEVHTIKPLDTELLIKAARETGAIVTVEEHSTHGGLGSAVAEVVGKLLRSLAAQAQVLCVTHLPQVAAQGHHHLQVSKSSDEKSVETRLDRLEADQKVAEIARMLGGVKITDQTLAHAREMLAQA